MASIDYMCDAGYTVPPIRSELLAASATSVFY